MLELLKLYMEHISGGAYRLNKSFLLELLEQNEGARVLDIGCADGEFSREIVNVTRGKVYGIDISPKYAERASRNGINVVLGDVDRGLPFQDESFDLVISNQVIEHVYSTDNFIKECYRILKNGGTCIASTPNLASFHSIISLMLGYQPPVTAVSDELICGNPLDPWNERRFTLERRHRCVFTALALRRLFEFHGFEIETLKGFGLHPLPVILSKYFKCTRYSLFLTIKARKSGG